MYEFLDRRYAQALYDVASSKGRVDQYIDDLKTIVKLIDESTDLNNVIHHPDISTKEKKKFFINLFKGKIDEDLLTFLLILIEKDRILFLREKLDELIQIDREHKNTIVVRVLTVRPLKDSQREAMIQKLSERYNKKIILEESLDPDLLGGIVIRVGDNLLDGSLRSSLDEMKKSMLNKIEVTSE